MNPEFREVVLMVLQRLGMEGVPESYLEDIGRLQEAGSEWHRLPGSRRLGFLQFDLPDLLSGTILTGNLPLAIERGWAKNAAAKAFVSYIDERTGHRGTLLMLQIILLLQEAACAAPVNAPGGRGLS